MIRGWGGISNPIGLEGGINTYAYVTGNPLSYSDAYGLYANFAIGLGVRVVGGRAAGAAVQSGLQGVVGRTAGRALSCALIGYCSEAGGAKEVGDRTEEEERQAQEEYDSIKYYCDDFPKRWDYPDECSFISRKIDHLNYCIDRFENFDLKWASG